MKTEDILNEREYSEFNDLLDQLVELSCRSNFDPVRVGVKKEIEDKKQLILDKLGFNLVTMSQIREFLEEYRSTVFRSGYDTAQNGYLSYISPIETKVNVMHEELLRMIDRFGNRCNWGVK